MCVIKSYKIKLLLFVFCTFIISTMSATKVPLKFHFVTYNVGTSSPDEDLHKLLKLHPDSRNDANKFDFYIIGLQEVKAQIQNMVMDAIFEDPWTNVIKDILEVRDFIKVKTIRLQGLLLNVFCLRKHLLHLHNIETQYTRTGLGGMWGNKGAVSVRFVLYGSSMCFVNAHLTAHDHMQAERIEDYHTILRENKFSAKVVTDILDHDFVFWFGDLNFRLMDEDSSSPEYIAEQISRNQLSMLYDKDQLNHARLTEAAFKEFTEQTPSFKPTFKFVVGTSDYDMKRRPAWTDRIMYKLKSEESNKETIKFEQLSYRSHEGYTLSDHKPVSSNFIIPIALHQDIKWCPRGEIHEIFTNYDLCDMDGDQVSTKDLPQAVCFTPIAFWNLDKENDVEYCINTNFGISFEDWIGIYKFGFSSLDDYKEYMYVRNGGPVSKNQNTDDENGEGGSTRQEATRNMLSFPDTSLHTPGKYILIYFGVQDGSTSILGISDAFTACKDDHILRDESN